MCAAANVTYKYVLQGYFKVYTVCSVYMNLSLVVYFSLLS